VVSTLQSNGINKKKHVLQLTRATGRQRLYDRGVDDGRVSVTTDDGGGAEALAVRGEVDCCDTGGDAGVALVARVELERDV